MDARITPEPTEAERRALVAALEPGKAVRNRAYASAWRRAALPSAEQPLPLRDGRVATKQ